jgi:hypothetical protein
MKIINFPLPDGYNPDYEDIGIVLYEYPDFGPAGIHIYDDSPNLEQIRRTLNGHVIANDRIQHLSGYREHVEELDGWTWICLHYNGWRWRFNPTNIHKGEAVPKPPERIEKARETC